MKNITDEDIEEELKSKIERAKNDNKIDEGKYLELILLFRIAKFLRLAHKD